MSFFEDADIIYTYTSQTRLPFILVTSNPQLIRGTIGKHWKIKRYGHASKMLNYDFSDSAKNLAKSTSRGRLTATLQYMP